MEEKKLTADTEINVGMIENALKCLAGQKPCDLCVYDDRSMQDGERSCINLVAEDTLDLIHSLQEHNGNEVRMRCDMQRKFDDLQNLCIEQKAEIERLTKLAELRLRDNEDTCRLLIEKERQVDELREQLLMAKLQGLNEGYNNGVQAERNAQIFKPMITKLPKEITEPIKQQAVKDTAKEILKIFDDKNYITEKDLKKAIAERYGVEVE